MTLFVPKLDGLIEVLANIGRTLGTSSTSAIQETRACDHTQGALNALSVCLSPIIPLKVSPRAPYDLRKDIGGTAIPSILWRK